MRSVVVYESMYGNTHLVANAIAEGIAGAGDVTVVSVDGATPDVLEGVDLVVIGGPTHIHSLSSSTSRKGAVDAANKPGSDLVLDPDAEGEGLRDWFSTLGPLAAKAAAFDTRAEGPPLLTGRASKGIARRLRHHDLEVIAEPESFLVSKQNVLEPGEADRARRWGENLAASWVAANATR